MKFGYSDDVGCCTCHVCATSYAVHGMQRPCKDLVLHGCLSVCTACTACLHVHASIQCEETLTTKKRRKKRGSTARQCRNSGPGTWDMEVSEEVWDSRFQGRLA